MVLDEAYKLLDAVRQMYGTAWSEQDAELIVSLSTIKGRMSEIEELAVLQGRVTEYNRQIFDRLAKELPGSHTREGNRAGIQSAAPSGIMETSKPPPFDFRNNGLLYIPERMPFPNIRHDRYIRRS